MTINAPIILAGGSGFLGQALIQHLSDQPTPIVVLTRGPDRQSGKVRYVNWDAKTTGKWVEHLNDAQAVLNIVGRTVDCVKTNFNKKVILDSRIDSVRALAAAYQQVPRPPALWVQTSTAHIYGDTHDEILDESSPIGTGFAPHVGTAWEKAFAEADLPNTRRVVLRVSFVIGNGGGAFKKLVPITRLFLGGATGSGQQYMSWIHETDYCRIVMKAIEDSAMHGMYVVTAPNPERNVDFMRLMRKQLHRPWWPRVPKPLLYIGAFVMRTDPELAMYGRRCVPTRLMNEGFSFKFPDLPSALADLLP